MPISMANGLFLILLSINPFLRFDLASSTDSKESVVFHVSSCP
jgi:hypothetical protein